MLLSIAIAVFLVLGNTSGNIIVYPAPQGVHASGKFQVFLTQSGHRHPCFTYISTSDHRTKDASHVKPGRSVSWTSFAFSGNPVTVEVHTPNDFHNCVVRPRSYGYHCKRTGPKTAQFTVDKTSKMMSVEFDYDYGSNHADIKDKMLIFIDPPESDIPSQHDNSVLYYKQGVHNLNGQIHLKPNIKTIYLAPGAFVEGGFLSTATHAVTIKGRGILSTGTYRWHDHRFTWGMINFDKGSHHVIEGITLVDPEAFFIRALSDHCTVRNVKMLAPWTYNSDGVGLGHDSLVVDTFMWTNDDSLKVYTDNMVVKRCVIWQAQNGAVFQFGWWTGRDMQKVRISDVDVIHTDWCTFKGDNCKISTNDAVFDLAGATKSFKVSDIILSNIRVEGSCPRIVNFKMDAAATGTVSNIHFDNWTIDSQPTHDSLHNEIEGSNHGGTESRWTFTNLKIGGHCINNPSQGDFKIGQHSNNIEFVCH